MDSDEGDLIKTIRDEDYPNIVKLTYTYIKDHFPQYPTISRFFELIKFTYSIKDWSANYWGIENANLQASLIDLLQRFMKGEAINFTKLKEKLYDTLELNMSEKLDLDAGSAEKRLWAIFLVLSRKEINFK